MHCAFNALKSSIMILVIECANYAHIIWVTDVTHVPLMEKIARLV
jgi:hypothetical protein